MAPATNADRPTTLPTMRSWCIFMASLNSCDAATSSSTSSAPKPTLLTMNAGDRSIDSGMPVDTKERSSSTVEPEPEPDREPEPPPDSEASCVAPSTSGACSLAPSTAASGPTRLLGAAPGAGADGTVVGAAVLGGGTYSVVLVVVVSSGTGTSWAPAPIAPAMSAAISATTETSSAAAPRCRCRSFTRTTATSHSRRLTADTHPNSTTGTPRTSRLHTTSYPSEPQGSAAQVHRAATVAEEMRCIRWNLTDCGHEHVRYPGTRDTGTDGLRWRLSRGAPPPGGAADRWRSGARRPRARCRPSRAVGCGRGRSAWPSPRRALRSSRRGSGCCC